MKALVMVVLGSLRSFLDIDLIEDMLKVAVSHLEARVNIFRVIPEGAPPLKYWAERQEKEGAPVRLYTARHWGGPVARNNLAILGVDNRMSRKAKEGKASAIIQLGPIPPHYTTTEEGTTEVKHHASTQETIFHYWATHKAKPTMLQVVSDGKDGWRVIDGKGGKWQFIDGDKLTMRSARPAPRDNASKARLAERSASFWSTVR